MFILFTNNVYYRYYKITTAAIAILALSNNLFPQFPNCLVQLRSGILSLNISFMLRMRGVGPEVWRTSETPSLYRSLRFAILVMPAAFIYVSNTFIYTVWVVDADENDNNVWQLPNLFIPCPVPESGCIYIKQFTSKKCRPIASYPASWFPVQKKKKAKRMLQHFFSLTVVAVLALLSSVLNIPTLVNLRIEGSTTTIFDHSYFRTQCDYAFRWRSPLRWDEQPCKSSSWSHLYQCIGRRV